MTAKADATGAPIVFEFRGKEYSVPAAIDWPVSALEAFEDGKVVSIVRSLLPEQWDEIKATVAPTVRDLNEFVGALAEGLNAPNS